MLNKKPLFEKLIIIKKDDDNIKLEYIDQYEIDFSNTNFYCTFLVKNSYYAKHRTFVWSRMKTEISKNYLYQDKPNILDKFKYPYIYSIFQKDKNAINPHLAYKMIYIK